MADYFDILQVHEITNGIGIFKQRSAAKKRRASLYGLIIVIEG
ncbi:TPA: hypothetical protein ACGSN2_002159 [Escherichia coli]|nr:MULTISPECIES: hypothetical protein [Escherichia]EOU45626.1 hypothetical protein WC5_01960 [Escherichia sp. KTE114]